MFGRKSGDPNTSIGNTFINAITYLIVKDSLFANKTSTAFMLGDDNIFGSNRLISKENIKNAYKALGLDVKVVVHGQMITSKFL